jgi:hypothetical protein
MAERLWFVSDGMDIIGVYNSRHDAELDYERFREDADFDYYKYYSIEINDLEDFPEEYDFALEQDAI